MKFSGKVWFMKIFFKSHKKLGLHKKQRILIFWTKFAQKEHFRLKRAKLKITIELYIFELV